MVPAGTAAPVRSYSWLLLPHRIGFPEDMTMSSLCATNHGRVREVKTETALLAKGQFEQAQGKGLFCSSTNLATDPSHFAFACLPIASQSESDFATFLTFPYARS
jgi:hypothetical protein